MSGLTRPEDARTAWLPLYGEDTFARARESGSSTAVVRPPPDPRLAPEWAVRGTLVSRDRPIGGLLGQQTVFYAWLLERAAAPGEFVVAVRGTGDLKEWFLDFEGGQLKPHWAAGRVEVGFADIYQQMTYRPAAGGDELPAAQGIARAIGAGRVTVTGHSLGSPLASFLGFDLAGMLGPIGQRVDAVLFASPRPGDADYGNAFNAKVPKHRSYWWLHDVVPEVPRGFGYTPIPGSIQLQPPAGTKIGTCPTCAHHALTYSRLIDPTAISSFKAFPEDQPFLACLGL